MPAFLRRALSCSRASTLLTLGVPGVFFVLGVIRAQPFVDDIVPAALSPTTDDWQVYKRYAESILQGGLTIPAVPGAYVRPAGFFYNYFLAGIFIGLGDNSSYVYVIQSVLLGSSVSIMYIALRGYISTIGGYLYLVLLAAYAYVDVFRNYSFRLLSENLLLVLLAVLFLLLFRADFHRSLPLAILAGGVLGLAVLTRINLLPVACGLTVIWFAYMARVSVDRRALVLPATFCFVWIAVMLLLPLRDYVVTGQVDFAVLTYTGDWNLPVLPAGITLAGDPPALLSLIEPYVRNLLFVLGDTTALGTAYRPRPHWVLLWAAFAVAVVLLWQRKRPPLFWEAVLYGFVVLYLGPIVFVGYPGTYGFRTILPALPAALFAGCTTLDAFLAGRIGRRTCA